MFKFVEVEERWDEPVFEIVEEPILVPKREDEKPEPIR